jgi:hypothetical protein
MAPRLSFGPSAARLLLQAAHPAPPPDLQEVGRLPRVSGTRGSSGPARIYELRRGLVAKGER